MAVLAELRRAVGIDADRFRDEIDETGPEEGIPLLGPVVGVTDGTGKKPFLEDEPVSLEFRALEIRKGVVAVIVRPLAPRKGVTDHAALIHQSLQRSRNSGLDEAEMAEIAFPAGGSFPVGGNGADILSVTGAAEIVAARETAPVVAGRDGEPPEEAVPRVGIVHVVTGDAGEFVIALDEGLEGEEDRFFDFFLHNADGEVHGMEVVTCLLVTLFAEEDRAVPLGNEGEGETVFIRHLVGDVRSDMAGAAGECVVGIRTGLEKEFAGGGQVQIEIGGNGSGREELGEQDQEGEGTGDQPETGSLSGDVGGQ